MLAGRGVPGAAGQGPVLWAEASDPRVVQGLCRRADLTPSLHLVCRPAPTREGA